MFGVGLKPVGKLIRKNTGRTCKVANYILRFMLAANHCHVSNQLWPFYSLIPQKCKSSCCRQSHQSRSWKGSTVCDVLTCVAASAC